MSNRISGGLPDRVVRCAATAFTRRAVARNDHAPTRLCEGTPGIALGMAVCRSAGDCRRGGLWAVLRDADRDGSPRLSRASTARPGHIEDRAIHHRVYRDPHHALVARVFESLSRSSDRVPHSRRMRGGRSARSPRADRHCRVQSLRETNEAIGRDAGPCRLRVHLRDHRLSLTIGGADGICNNCGARLAGPYCHACGQKKSTTSGGRSVRSRVSSLQLRFQESVRTLGAPSGQDSCRASPSPAAEDAISPRPPAERSPKRFIQKRRLELDSATGRPRC